MNQAQRAILGVGCAIAAAMIILPPWTIYGEYQQLSRYTIARQEKTVYAPAFGPPEAGQINSQLLLMQLAALVLGPVHNLGDQNYHYTAGTLDRTDDSGCDGGCLFPPLLATGDTLAMPVGHDHARAASEKADTARAR